MATVSEKSVLLYDYPGSICSQMARLALEEKGVEYDRQTVDIIEKAEQFEPWYTALNPRAVVPTLVIDGEVVTDTIRIVNTVEDVFDGPALTPSDEQAAEHMRQMMSDIMGLHYGVLLYCRTLAPDGSSPTIVARGKFLRRQLQDHPERADVLEKRIAGNERLQRILSDAEETERHIGDAELLVERINSALDDHDFISADHLTLADTFAAAALARFRLHGFEDWWADGRNANIGRYYKRLKARPSWKRAEIVDSGSESAL